MRVCRLLLCDTALLLLGLDRLQGMAKFPEQAKMDVWCETVTKEMRSWRVSPSAYLARALSLFLYRHR